MGSGLGKLEVLLVDDYKSIRDKLEKELRGLGLVVTTAGNGVEALGLLRSKRFDLLFTDIVMPEMDGFELCQEVRTAPGFQDIPIIVTSTHCDTEYVMKALRLGADDYVSKPVDYELLKQVVARVLAPTLPK